MMPELPTEIIKLHDTYADWEYGDVTECVVVVKQGGNVVILRQDDLEKLAVTMNARFEAI